MELVSLFDAPVQASLSLQIEAMQPLLPDFLECFRDAARRNDLHILAGSFPVRLDDGSYRNRSYFFDAGGRADFQEKLQMTRFENERWNITAGSALRVFDTDLGRVGVSVCYDCEFPLFARRQVEAGAAVILVPSCTDTLAGYHRVRIGCRARALENQCYVVQASTVGSASWSEAVDVNVGAAGFFSPVDRGFPDDGILAAGELNRPGWLYGDADLAATERVRREGQVFNFNDWPAQFRELDGPD